MTIIVLTLKNHPSDLKFKGRVNAADLFHFSLIKEAEILKKMKAFIIKKAYHIQ